MRAIIYTYIVLSVLSSAVLLLWCVLRSYKFFFHHAVTPQVSLTISQPVAKLGSSVNISCTAKSFPPANDTSFFHLLSPQNRRLYPNQSASVGTGVEYHIAHVNKSHGGEYRCFVNVEGYLEDLQSNTVGKELTVYSES